jgi:hypothetical protein
MVNSHRGNAKITPTIASVSCGFLCRPVPSQATSSANTNAPLFQKDRRHPSMDLRFRCNGRDF